jgi:hypothetical protein
MSAVRPMSMSREVELTVAPAALLDALVHIGQELDPGTDLWAALDILRSAQEWVDSEPAGVNADYAANTRDEALTRLAKLLGPVVWRMSAEHARMLGDELEHAGLLATGHAECPGCGSLVHRADATENGYCTGECDAQAQERQGTR